MGRAIKTAIIGAVVTFAVVATGGALGAIAIPAGMTAMGMAATYAAVSGLGALALAGVGMLTSKGIEASRENFGTKVAGRGASNPRVIIYGECRVGGTITQMHTTGTDNTKLCMFVVLSGHPIEAITAVRFNDTTLTFSGSITNGAEKIVTNSSLTNTDNDNNLGSGRLVRFVGFDGSQTARSSMANGTLGSTFVPTTHKFEECAYVYFEMIYDAEKLNNIPNLSFTVKGKKVFDPRDTNQTFGTSSGYTWSNNAALCVLDYLTDTTYGLKAVRGELNLSTDAGGFAAAANTCEQQAAAFGGSTEDRYTVNGFTNFAASGEGVLEGLLSASGGTLTYASGVFNIFVAAAQTPSLTITDNDMLEPPVITTKPNLGNVYNEVKTVFVDSVQSYKTQDTPIFRNSTYVTEDTPSGAASANYIKSLELQTPFTVTHTTSQRLGRIALNASRQQVSISVTVGLNFLKLQPKDWVYVTNDRLSYSQKIFEVLSVQLTPIGSEDAPAMAVQLNLKETASSVSGFVTNDYTTPLAGATGLAMTGTANNGGFISPFFTGTDSLVDGAVTNAKIGSEAVSEVNGSTVTTVTLRSAFTDSTTSYRDVTSITYNTTGKSTSKVLITGMILPLIFDGNGGNNGNTLRGSNTIKVLRGSTTILEGEYGFSHKIDSDDTATTAVRVVPDTGGQIAFSVVDTNVAAGSNTYKLQVKGQIARTAKATLSAINLMK